MSEMTTLAGREALREQIRQRFLDLAAKEGLSLVCTMDDPEVHTWCVGIRACLCRCHDGDVS